MPPLRGMRPLLARHGAFAIILASLAVLYLWLTWYDDLGGLKGDSLIYLNTARHYAPWWPVDPIAAIWAGVTQFPPAYPVLLAASGGIFDFRLAHAATTLCLLGALAGLYAWLLAQDVARPRAAVAVALVGIAPGTFLQSFYLHPEGLYVTLVFAALALLTLAERTARPAWLWGASALVAVAILTRTVGVTLLPALSIALVRSRLRPWPLMLALAVLPAFAWSLAHRPGWTYSDTLTETYLGAPFEAILRTVQTALAAIAAGLPDNLVRAGPQRALAALLGAAAAVIALWRFFRGRPDAWYVLAYVGTLALWPYPQEAQRLTWVLVPFLIGYLVWSGEQLALRAPPALARLRPAVAWLPAALLLLALLPEFALLAGRAVHPLARANPAYRHYPEWYEPQLELAQTLTESRLRTVEALRRFASQVPADECVYSTLSQLNAGFFTRRHLRFPPPESLDDGAFAEAIRRGGCRYFIFTLEFDRARGFTRSFYPVERVRDRVEVLDLQRGVLGGRPDAPVAVLAVLRPR